MNASGTIEFGPPNEMNCSLMLSAIDKYLSDHSDEISIQVLAYSTQILTSRPEHLTSSNITSAANILNQIFSMKTSDTTVAVAAMTTVSQLLFVSPQLVTGHDTELIPQQLESFLLNHTELLNVVQPKLAIQTTQVKISETAFIQFQALSGLSNNFTSSRIKLNSSKTEIKANDIPNDMQISIHLFPSDHADEKEEVKMGFALYDNDVLFQSKIFQPQLGTRRRVISASLDNANIQKDVNFSFKMDVQDVLNELVYDIACVSWDFTLKDWSNKGCFKVLSKSGSLLCRCNHTTNFAVLMSFSPDYKYAQALTWISTLGCTASIVGLGLTILFQIVTRFSPTYCPLSPFPKKVQEYQPNSFATENIIPSSDLHQDPDKGPCTIFTALMQYFLLATFTWNTLYGAHIFLVIKKTLKGPPRWFLPFSIVMGWGSPAIIVALSLGLTYKVERPLDYRQEEFCWLAVLSISGSFDITKPMLWGFLLPVGIMLLFNTGVLVYFVHTTCNTNPLLTSTNKKTLKKKLMSSFSLGSVLGLSWVLGYLLLSMPPSPNLNILLSVAFCVATTTQGLQIFILFTVRTSLFQQKFSHVVNSMPAPEIALHSGKFILWDNNESGTHELYRGIDMDSRNENTYQNQ
ncbi:adhesion G-protein coupled receptor G7-like [Denticeps clupeoides]|uniref:adhesion G-protein coupled receptor G7-like n=1 Tax=Denticeps clupeoides TaxID=299321 RepID=UPI0010A48990|nr:adhesion G-protein coupled receptor G7-like [Denticeps clupeoides]